MKETIRMKKNNIGGKETNKQDKRHIWATMILVILTFIIFIIMMPKNQNGISKNCKQTNFNMITNYIENDSFMLHDKISKKKNNIEAKSTITKKERKIIECIVMGEAGNESYEGQMLVAQCIKNACDKDNLSPSEVRVKYQYSGWDDNPTQKVKNVVEDVFIDNKKITEEKILYFYAPAYCYSEWHESQRYILTEGGHRFFADK